MVGEAPGLMILGDAAYGSGDTLSAISVAGHQPVIKPWPIPVAVPGGFHRDDFIVDYEAKTATCPNGHTVSITKKGAATFGSLCRSCPHRERCTTRVDGRAFRLSPNDRALVESRRVSPTTTGSGAPWSSDPLPGWWPKEIGGFVTVASRGTTSASRTEWPPSISGAWSTLAWTSRAAGRSLTEPTSAPHLPT